MLPLNKLKRRNWPKETCRFWHSIKLHLNIFVHLIHLFTELYTNTLFHPTIQILDRLPVCCRPANTSTITPPMVIHWIHITSTLLLARKVASASCKATEPLCCLKQDYYYWLRGGLVERAVSTIASLASFQVWFLGLYDMIFLWPTCWIMPKAINMVEKDGQSVCVSPVMVTWAHPLSLCVLV